jgi:DAK2 domain fusion protein YloV
MVGNNNLIKIDIKLLKQMFCNGANEIKKNYEYINDLNVFPVPDGDTGNNMWATVEGGIKKIENNEFADLKLLNKSFYTGLLFGARGNSGVILSQIFKGFGSVFKEGQTEISIEDVSNALINAKTFAYSAVSQPVEGTILTVIRVTSERIAETIAEYKTMLELFDAIVKESEIILAKTKDILPALKEVGVVDSGGYGLVKFLTGMRNVLSGNVDVVSAEITETKKPVEEVKKTTPSAVDKVEDNNDGFGYCNEFIMTLGQKVVLQQKKKDQFILDAFKKKLNSLGDSLVVVVDDNIVKVHVHTPYPYKILQYAQKFGEFNKVKIENMTNQFLENHPGSSLSGNANKSSKDDEKSVKIVATVQSENLVNIYKNELNINDTINTELTGNPSIKQFVDAIEYAKANNIIVVVDDSNIIMAATHAIKLSESNIELITANNAVSSYVACLAFNPMENIKKNVKNMKAIISKLVVGKISQSVKSVKYKHINVVKNDYIGIIDKKIIISDKDFCASLIKLVDQLFSNLK